MVVLQQAISFLAGRLRYHVPPQDLGYNLARMPSRLRSGFIMKNVRLVEAAVPAPIGVGGCPFYH